MFQMTFAQQAVMLKGKVFANNEALAKVEIINETKKTQAVSDDKGTFEISVSDRDVVFFFSKKCDEKKILVSKQIMNLSELNVELQVKSIQLDEIKILGDKKNLYKVTFEDVTTVNLNKEAAKPQNGIYTGQITQGADIGEIGKLIGKWLGITKEKPQEKITVIDFEKKMKSKYDILFFLKTLNLKVEQIDRFLTFCRIDENAQVVARSQNELEIIDFFIKKRADFEP
jgi:hypothetical protein